MSKQFFVLNIMFIIADTIISALGILAFAWGAWSFQKWWMLMFMLIPLALFSQRRVIVEKGGEV